MAERPLGDDVRKVEIQATGASYRREPRAGRTAPTRFIQNSRNVFFIGDFDHTRRRCVGHRIRDRRRAAVKHNDPRSNPSATQFCQRDAKLIGETAGKTC